MKNRIPGSELILNRDGSIYHLKLLPEDVSPIILTVGDPARVHTVSKYFDRIELKKNNREFCTHTGYIGNKRLTVLSTGIGTDNIDIVLNELDALVNIDLKTLNPKDTHTSLQLIRVGTSGSLSEHIPLNSVLCTEYGLGLEGLLHFYDYSENEEEKLIKDAFDHFIAPEFSFLNTYVVKASDTLQKKIGSNMLKGITATCQGFYHPQGRSLRLENPHNILEKLKQFHFQEHRITNFEMETAGILGLAKIMGHEAISISLLIANRLNNTFSKEPEKEMDKLIQCVLERL